MPDLDHATGDSPGDKKSGITKRKVALPLLLVIGVVGGVLVFFIARRQSGASGAGQAAQAGLPYPTGSAQQPAFDNSMSGLQALIGNLGQQMDANFAALQKATPVTPPVTSTGPPVGSQGDFSLSFGGGQGQQSGGPTILSQAGNVVTAFNVNPQLGGEWGTIYYQQNAAPSSVYQEVQDIYSAYGLGTPPTSGMFKAGSPSGARLFPFYAPGHAPGIVMASGPTASA